MEVDLGLLGSGGGSQAVGTHFITAGVTVALAQALATLHLAVPAVVFAAAANNTPSLEDDGRWHWRYTASNQGQLWTSHLSGAVQGNNVVWDVRVTAPQANPPLNEFVWFSGTSATDGTSGVWSFFDPQSPSTSIEVARIEWTHESEELREVVFRSTAGPHAADELTVSHIGNDRIVTFFDASENQTTEIGWDVSTREGYIFSIHYNNGQRSCWDGDLNNTPCS